MENFSKLNFLEQYVISSTKHKNEYGRIKFPLPIEHRLRTYNISQNYLNILSPLNKNINNYNFSFLCSE